GIRPIVITGIVTKLMEVPLNQELKQVLLNKAQLGFREKLGTELNILRLRTRAHQTLYENYDRKRKLKKIYILFVDLKQAFDRVNQEILIKKLVKKNVKEEVINTLILLLNSGLISIDLINRIRVNSGVGQGKICSPLEFDIYIDDLLDMAEKECHTPLAFADDTAFICSDMNQLIATTKTLEYWANENKIEINKKKSGILIVNDDSADPNSIEGYSVVNEYKYLGILLDNKLNPKRHISSINAKLKTYLKRNKMLHKKFFTPFSLIRIADYFVKSRLSYGLCCYIDNKVAMESIEKTLLRHLKSIFDLPENTSHRRLQIVLGEPDLRVRLSIRLLKNWHKYKEHFEEEPEAVKKVLTTYFSEEELSNTPTTAQYEALKSDLINKNLCEKGNKEYLGVTLRNNHREFLKKYVFCYPDRRDFLVIKYFTRTCKLTNTRLFPQCECGEDNTPEHAANSCTAKMNEVERKIHTKEFKDLFEKAMIDIGADNQLNDYLLWTMFKIEDNMERRAKIRQMIEKMKTVITKLMIKPEERKDYTEI
ncbi:MAG: RNA-directed DNA polymerase, partial [Flammeovirgaceae bacterium]